MCLGHNIRNCYYVYTKILVDKNIKTRSLLIGLEGYLLYPRTSQSHGTAPSLRCQLQMVSMIIFFSPIYYLWRFVFFGWEYNNEKPGLMHFNYVVGFAKMKVGRMFNFARWPRLKVGAVKGNRNWKSWKYKSTDKGADLCKRRKQCDVREMVRKFFRARKLVRRRDGEEEGRKGGQREKVVSKVTGYQQQWWRWWWQLCYELMLMTLKKWLSFFYK